MHARLQRLAARIAVLAVLVSGVCVAAPAPSAEAATDTLTFTGRGFGPGRGMGQWGALGYAVDDGWSAQQILTHYYQGTSLATDAGNPTIGVEITGYSGRETLVTGRSLTLNGVAVGAGAVRLARTAAGKLQAYSAPSCAGPWTPGAVYESGAVVATSASDADPAHLVRLCGPGSGPDTAYRGVIRATVSGSTQYTVNELPMQSYLRGVVPHEMSASWGSLGSGRGQQALMAQAVAARSYVLAPRSGPRASGATTCDSTSCQVYSGAASVTRADVATSLEFATSDAAVASTAGWVMRSSSTRAVAMTEYSASTGGYTAGGTFAPVVDDGDDYAANPNRSWTVTKSVAEVASALGTGTIRSIDVTARNGLGALGGRASTVTVTSTAGAVTTFTGDQVRSRLGLKSNWFAISGWTTATAQAVVKALYADLLGRGVDPTGLNTWTTRLLQGTSQTELVATLTRSDEYINLRVAKAYREVLGREPEPAGAANWLVQIRSNRATVDDVQRRFYDSTEYYNRAGGTPEGYVQRLFQTALGRPASAGELATWAARMNAPDWGRARVADGIWMSLEAGKVRAGAYYRVFLQREPDGPGLQNWATVLVTQGEGAVRIGMAGSQEYRQRAVNRFPS